ncbi:MAG: polysaccharide deacetylase family protein [Saprospiraceae bacterium]|nr:polysaccharide deacetylase family protein [Saprospiraceae bacterium]
MYLSFTPKFLQDIFPDLIWRMNTGSKELFLTFDDGPIPVVTPWILDVLAEHGAKASFFCVGQNVEKNPEIFDRLIGEGHSVGSHTHHHLSGWSTNNLDYILDVRTAARLCRSKLFRPPYGRLRPSQVRFLKHHYKIIMWDVLSGDFDPAITAEDCFQNILKNSQPGSIVVLHDSLKTFEKMKFVLPAVLNHFADLGYRFSAIDSGFPTAHLVKEELITA